MSCSKEEREEKYLVNFQEYTLLHTYSYFQNKLRN